MRYIRFFGAFCLVATLSACSDSGSSSDIDATTSTNIIPASNNTVDNGTSSGPSNDQPTSAGDTDSTDNNADAGSTGSSATTDGDSTSDAEQTDGGGEAGTDAGNGSDGGGTSDADVGGDTNGGTDSSDGGNTASGDGNTDPIIDPDSALGGLQSRIKLLTARTLLALNQSLNQGEMLSAQQEQCLGTYDPAIGEPLLSIDCDQPLATGEVPIFASVASLKDTPECQASLQNANADACSVNQAEFSVSPIFTIPETGTPQVKQAGAAISYNIVQDRLILENLTPALTGTFFCEYDLTNGNAIGGDPGGNCDNQVNRICDLIDEQLAIEN